MLSSLLPKTFVSHVKHRAESLRDKMATVDSLPQLTLLGLMTGIFAGVVIVLFRWAVEIPLGFFLPGNFENFEAISPISHFILPIVGALALGTVLQLVDKRHHAAGVGHVIDRLQNHQGRMPWGNYLVQFWGGTCCLLTGHSVGREGPAVHLGAGAGSLLGQWLKLPGNSLRPLAGCGVAAAIAACFNTPMAGVIFAMEVVVMEYSIAGFIPVILAAVAGTTISHLVFGDIINFEPLQPDQMSFLELPLVIISGLFIALLAAAYIRLQGLWCKHTLNWPIILRFAMAGVVTGTAAYGFPQIMGVGYDTIEQTLIGDMGFWLLLGIVAAKLLVTSMALGVGIPGGVIGPLLFIGACAGGAIGIVANTLMPSFASPVGFYVVLGMGAMMGATLNAPMAAMMAILELTYNPGIIFPSMLMVVVACLTTRWAFRCEGLFDTVLKIQGKFRTPQIAEQLLSKTGTRQLLDRHFRQCAAELSSAEATEILSNHPHWLILDNPQQLLAAQDLAAELAREPNKENIKLLEIAGHRQDMIQLPPDSTLFEAQAMLKQAQVEAGYVINHQGHIIGIITLEKINNYYKL